MRRRPDLSGLGGGSAVVFASGFLRPEANQGGASFIYFYRLQAGEFTQSRKMILMR